MAKGIGQPVVLSALRKQVNVTALRYAQSRAEIDGLSTAQVVKIFAADTFEWHDTERFVMSYHDLVDAPGSPVEYTRAVDLHPPSLPFPCKNGGRSTFHPVLPAVSMTRPMEGLNWL